MYSNQMISEESFTSTVTCLRVHKLYLQKLTGIIFVYALEVSVLWLLIVWHRVGKMDIHSISSFMRTFESTWTSLFNKLVHGHEVCDAVEAPSFFPKASRMGWGWGLAKSYLKGSFTISEWSPSGEFPTSRWIPWSDFTYTPLWRESKMAHMYFNLTADMYTSPRFRLK